MNITVSAHGLLLLLLLLEPLSLGLALAASVSPYVKGDISPSHQASTLRSSWARGKDHSAPRPLPQFPQARRSPAPRPQARSTRPRARPHKGLTWSPRRRRRLGSSMARESLHRTRPRLRPSARGPAIDQAGQLTRVTPPPVLGGPTPLGEPALPSQAPPHPEPRSKHFSMNPSRKKRAWSSPFCRWGSCGPNSLCAQGTQQGW